MGSKWANGVTFVVFSHNSAIYADDVARVITSRTMTASGAEPALMRPSTNAQDCPQAVINGFFLAGAARSRSRARSGSYLASGSALCDRIFREDLLDPFERPVRGGLRR
jgi:hypothetical protein